MPNYIDGEFKPSISDRRLKIYNPALDEVIGEVPIATADEMSEAIDSAYEAFHRWREIPITKRIQYLFRIKEILENHFEEISRVVTQNHGKTIHEARGDMRRTIENVEAGNIGVNIGIPAPVAFFPFAGRKRSFYGVLHPQIDTIDFFTDKKVVIVRP